MKAYALAATAILTLGSLSKAALGAGPLGPENAAIQTSQYAVDPSAGVVLAGSRVTGLAGAYVAIAEGVDGNVQTPVAPAVRPAYSVDHFDYDVGFGILLPATLKSTDYFNTGHGNTQLNDAQQDETLFLTPAVNLQWGGFGIGLSAEIQNYGLTRSLDGSSAAAERDRLSGEFVTAHLQTASMFWNRQIVFGIGLRASSLTVEDSANVPEERLLFETTGAGFEVGGLWTPRGWPLRVGVAFRSAISTQANPSAAVQPDANGDRIIGDPADVENALYLPERVAQPWDLNAGVAFSIGPRPMNPHWIDPRDRTRRAKARNQRRAVERRARRAGRATTLAAKQATEAQIEMEDAIDELHVERLEDESRRALESRYARLARSYVLVSLSVLVTGSVDNAVGVESFLQRRVARVGRQTVVSPRIGIETEAIPYWLKVRGGSYLEPTRFRASRSRLHGTFGFDAKLFSWSVFGIFDDDTEWRMGGALDGARRYLSWGVSVGVWH